MGTSQQIVDMFIHCSWCNEHFSIKVLQHIRVSLYQFNFYCPQHLALSQLYDSSNLALAKTDVAVRVRNTFLSRKRFES